MNDYERLADDLDAAISAAETAYYNAQDEEDQASIDDALDILKDVRDRAREKAA